MDTDNVVRLLEIVAEFGVNRFRFTGGEPMLQRTWRRSFAGSPAE